MSKGLSSYLLYSLIAILVICLYLGDFTGMQKLQWKIDDLMYSFRSGSTNVSDIVLVNIDDKSLNDQGEWPWSYDVLADLIAVCNSAEPQSILLNLDLAARTSEDTLGNTQILANQISWGKNLILPYDIALAEYSHQRFSKPKYLFNSSISISSDYGLLDEDQALNIRKPFLPSDLICEHANAMGFNYFEYAHDGKIRRMPVIANYEGFYYPSISLLTATAHLGMTANDILISGGKEINIGGIYTIPTDEHGRVQINYSTANSTFTSYSASDFINEKGNVANLKGRMVIISLTASGLGYFYNTPVSPIMSQPELLANVAENIIHSNYITNLDLAAPINIVILLGFGLICAFILPRVTLSYRMIILSVFLIILANLNYMLFNSYNVLPRTLYLGLEIILLMIASPLIEETKAEAKEKSKFRLSSLLSFGRKKDGETDSGKSVPIRKITDTGNEQEHQKTEIIPQAANSGSIENAPNASQSLSMSPTTALNSDIPSTQPAEFDPNCPLDVSPLDKTDSPSSYEQHGNISLTDQNTPLPNDMSAFGQSSSGAIVTPDSASIPTNQAKHPEPELEITPTPTPQALGGSDGIEKLGRYKIVGALGKGAMGTVYKGIDPAINRPVALKTIRLDFVADENEMNELRDRLFREAHAAGKLSHPNIVTIYDVGSEGSLQYIAMEYLEGQDLEDLIKRKVQFSYKIIANIISQICDALDYAHSQGIVHRDIKPANIMVLKDYSVKVMDFGIARVDSSSMTKTGIAMGTPNYIAPELLQGMGVDKRCDIFSLGVVIYELLTGRRPFKGENMTALIYSIIHDEPLPPSTVNPKVPALFDHVVTNALKKNPKERYQKAIDIRKSLVDFVGSFSGTR
ncbi:MAG: CHASE2 domain-containing protein [candidate division Zixibacteria bacterium]|nr:CHASE2 domain-containing protein [candidate division Zixibacteria bacterium]